jgi:uncharacterized protein DUF1566
MKRLSWSFAVTLVLAFFMTACGGGGDGDVAGENVDSTIKPPSLTDNGDGTVADSLTGLVWQKQDDAASRKWIEANAYCSGLSLGGKTGWRLPSRMELISIVDYGRASPSIYTTFFPNTIFSTTSFKGYWGLAEGDGGTPNAWGVNFDWGYSYLDSKSNSEYVRCVRGGQANPANFIDNGNGTVTDSASLLMWQRGEGGAMSWHAALSYCEGLVLPASSGHDDWRLPNVKELSSLFDDTNTNFTHPGINALFSGAVSENYWSSTTFSGNTPVVNSSFAWNVLFSYGYTGVNPKSNSSSVRCVRGGQ